MAQATSFKPAAPAIFVPPPPARWGDTIVPARATFAASSMPCLEWSARPTPDSGVPLFFATDIGQNGTFFAYNPHLGRYRPAGAVPLLQVGRLLTCPPNLQEQLVIDLALPPGLLGENDVLGLRFTVRHIKAHGNATVRVLLGDTDVGKVETSAVETLRTDAEIRAQDSGIAQRTLFSINGATPSSQVTYLDIGKQLVRLRILASLADARSILTFDGVDITLLPGF